MKLRAYMILSIFLLLLCSCQRDNQNSSSSDSNSNIDESFADINGNENDASSTDETLEEHTRKDDSEFMEIRYSISDLKINQSQHDLVFTNEYRIYPKNDAVSLSIEEVVVEDESGNKGVGVKSFYTIANQHNSKIFTATFTPNDAYSYQMQIEYDGKVIFDEDFATSFLFPPPFPADKIMLKWFDEDTILLSGINFFETERLDNIQFYNTESDSYINLHQPGYFDLMTDRKRNSDKELLYKVLGNTHSIILTYYAEDRHFYHYDYEEDVLTFICKYPNVLREERFQATQINEQGLFYCFETGLDHSKATVNYFDFASNTSKTHIEFDAGFQIVDMLDQYVLLHASQVSNEHPASIRQEPDLGYCVYDLLNDQYYLVGHGQIVGIYKNEVVILDDKELYFVDLDSLTVKVVDVSSYAAITPENIAIHYAIDGSQYICIEEKGYQLTS